MTTIETLTGPQKAAVLLLTLGVEPSAQIFKHMGEDEIEAITAELARMKSVSSKVSSGVIEEFMQMASAQTSLSTGGVQYAQEVLEKALGKPKATEMISRIQGLKGATFFTALRTVDPQFLLNALQDESPQIVAIVLSHLESKTAGAVLSGLSPSLKADIIGRIALMEKAPPDFIGEIDRILNERLASVINQEVSLSGGITRAAQIMNFMDRNSERSVFQTLLDSEPAVAQQIRTLMFTFDDLVRVDDRGIQRVLQEIDKKELAMAMKAIDQQVKEKLFANMSERAREQLQEEISYLGPVKLRDVEAAQQKIIALVRRLDETGEIIVQGRGGGVEEEIIV